MTEVQLLKDLILEHHKSIGEFYRKNLDHPLMPTRDRLYRMLGKDIRDNQLKDIFVILTILGIQDSIVDIVAETLKGEEDFYEICDDRHRDKGVSD